LERVEPERFVFVEEMGVNTSLFMCCERARAEGSPRGAGVVFGAP
jgi:hypothetical protein